MWTRPTNTNIFSAIWLKDELTRSIVEWSKSNIVEYDSSTLRYTTQQNDMTSVSHALDFIQVILHFEIRWSRCVWGSSNCKTIRIFLKLQSGVLLTFLLLSLLNLRMIIELVFLFRDLDDILHFQFSFPRQIVLSDRVCVYHFWFFPSKYIQRFRVS